MANVDVRQDNQPVITADTPDSRFSAGEAAQRMGAQETHAKRQFLSHLVIGSGLSLVWLFAVVSYAYDQVGLFDFFALPLYEAALIVVATSVPILLVWLVLLYMRRDRELRSHRMALEARLDLLTYPDTAAGDRVREITSALQRQTEELSRASLAAVERVRDADELLRQRANQLWHASDGARGRAESLADEIGERAKELEASVDGISIKGDDISALLRGHSDNLEATVQEGVARTQEIVAAFEEKLQAISVLTDNATDLAGERAEELKKEIVQQLDALALTVDHAAGQAENTSRAVGATIREEMDKATQATEENAKRLYRVIDEMHEKAASLTSGFGGDVGEIVNEIDRVGNKADEIDAKLRSHLEALTSTIDAAEEKSGRISETLKQDGLALQQVTEGVVSQASQASDDLNARLDDLRAAAEDISERSATIAEAATETQGKLSEVGENFSQQTEVLKSIVAESSAELTTAGDNAVANAVALQGAIEGAAVKTATFSERTEKLAGRVQQVINFFESHSGDMGTVVAQTLDGLQERGDALEDQLGRINAASDLVKAEANALDDTFSHHINMLEDAADKAAAAGGKIGDDLAERTRELETVLKSISELDTGIDSGVEKLRLEAQLIATATETSTEALGEILDKLGEGREEALSASTIAVTAYDKVNEVLRSNTDNLLTTANETGMVVDQIDGLATSLEARMKDLGRTLENQIAKLTEAEKSLESGAQAVGETVGREGDRIETARASIEQSSAGLTSTIDQLENAGQLIAANFSDISDGLGDQFIGVEMRAQAVQETINKMMETLESRARELDDAALHSSEVARLVSQAFHTQARELIAASDQAAEKTEEIYQRHAGARRKTFMRDLAFITESLNSKSVDITRAIEQNVPEEAWTRYLEGDRSVFTRALLKRTDTFSLMAIKNLFRDDEEFRDHVNRYIRLFEEAVEQAEENDPDDVLSSTLLSSDVGKLYLLLSRALDRIR